MTLWLVAVLLGASWSQGVPLPAGYEVYDGTLITHDFDEGVFIVGTAEAPKRGRFAQGYLRRQPEGFHEPADAAWKKWLPVLTAAGWQLKGQAGESYSLQKGDESLLVNLSEYQDPKLIWVKASKGPRALVLQPPTPKTVEAVSEKQHWPFLEPFAGATLENTATTDAPLDVSLNGVDKEPHLVGRTYVVKQYTPPTSLSKLEFELSLRAALTKAGWSVLPLPEGVREGEGTVRAHYAKNGRDLWAVLTRAADDSNTGMAFAIVDLGADDWSSALARDCRLPLYGVTFEFDKATLKPEATPVLEKAVVALKSNASLNVEVQGHTDDVGDDAYNQTLSGKRAEAVRAWLAAHQIAAARLTAKGYGKTQPVVENSSDSNRARNRRVELKCQTSR